MQVILMKVKSDPSQLAALSQIGTVETSSAGFVKNSGDGGFTGSALISVRLNLKIFRGLASY
jgi:hypothetical protein